IASVNATLPVGITPATLANVEVITIASPSFGAAGASASDGVTVAFATDCTSVADAFELKCASPEYAASIACDPTPSAAGADHVARPLASSGSVATVTPPSLNVTFPDGVPAAGPATVALTVI